MAVNGPAPFLPQEIITDILKRLPVKSLIRFRCVCKHWKNLVHNPTFITDHLRHSGHHNPNFLFFHPSSYEYEKTGKLNLLNCEMQVRDLQKAPLFDYLCARRFKIIGSSNGLLCVKIRRNELARPPSVLLWNPATKDVREVPRSRTIDSCKFGCEFGFGFNSSLNDFKIVAIDHQIDRMGVYSLSTDSWKEIELKNFPEDFTFFDETAVFSNEAIFWKGEIGGEEGKEVIVSFDTTKEVFTFIPWPTNTALNTLRSLYFVNITVYKDKLAIFHSGGDGSLWVWVMEEDIGSSRERWNWTKKFIGGHYPQMFNCVGTIWRNEIVIVGNTETRAADYLAKASLSSLPDLNPRFLLESVHHANHKTCSRDEPYYPKHDDPRRSHANLRQSVEWFIPTAPKQPAGYTENIILLGWEPATVWLDEVVCGKERDEEVVHNIELREDQIALVEMILHCHDGNIDASRMIGTHRF
ncbi:hypothetical protein K1719_032732 [Acacia pycnantha]|nr:hypothetical protein K1719_032732 [Acacia pycnantha]